MDHFKKMLLSQSVTFMQQHLPVNLAFLNTLAKKGILSQDQVTTIEKDDIKSGRVLELLCLLRHKNNRDYERFVAALEETGCHKVALLLRNKGKVPQGTDIADHRTIDYLETYIGKKAVNERTMADMACNLVLHHVHDDEVSRLHDTIEQHLNTIKQQENDYDRLKRTTTESQEQYQETLMMNAQLLNVLNQMNQLQLMGMTGRTDGEETRELEQKLKQSEQEVQRLEGDMNKISEDLDSTNRELDRAIRREKQYKVSLGLGEDATTAQVEQRIKEKVHEGSDQRRKAEEAQRELSKMKTKRYELETSVKSLTRQKEHVEFELRNKDMTMKKMMRTRVYANTIQRTQALLDTASSGGGKALKATPLPRIHTSTEGLSLTPTGSARQGHRKYCVFCRADYDPVKAQKCRIHYRAIRSGSWTCCQDDSHRSAGCLQIPHFYIEISANHKVLLTDGISYLEM